MRLCHLTTSTHFAALVLARRQPIWLPEPGITGVTSPDELRPRAQPRGAGRRGLCQELVRLAISVSWPCDRDLDLDDGSASGLALDLDPASERFDSIPEPGQSRPPPRIGSADAVIANRKQKHVVLDAEGDPHARGVRVL